MSWAVVLGSHYKLKELGLDQGVVRKLSSLTIHGFVVELGPAQLMTLER